MRSRRKHRSQRRQHHCNRHQNFSHEILKVRRTIIPYPLRNLLSAPEFFFAPFSTSQNPSHDAPPAHGHADAAKTVGMPQGELRSTRALVDLPRYNTRDLRHGLLYANTGCPLTVWSRIGREPGKVDASTDVHACGNKKRSKVFNTRRHRREKNGISSRHEWSQSHKWDKPLGQLVGEQSDREIDKCAPDKDFRFR